MHSPVTNLKHLLCHTGRLLCVLLPVTLISVPVLAQDNHAHLGERRNDYLPSISNMEIKPAAKKGGKTAGTVTGEALTDAILADTLRSLSTQTDAHWHKGEYNHIVNLNRILFQGDPRNLEAYANSAYLLWSMDRKEEATATLKLGIKNNPGNFYMYDELGQHYMVRREWANAIPYYEQAVKFKVPYSTWNALANCYQRTNQLEKAVKAWEVAATFPENRIAATRLARARAELARKK